MGQYKINWKIACRSIAAFSLIASGINAQLDMWWVAGSLLALSTCFSIGTVCREI